MGFGRLEFQAGMRLPGANEGFFREIDANAIIRLRGSQQVSRAAPDLEHPLPRADQKPVDLLNAAVVPASHAAPGVALAGDSVPLQLAGADELFA